MRKLLSHFVIYLLSFFWAASISWAGGAIQVDILGNPLLWDVQDTLIYNPENGALKSAGAFDQTNTLALLKNAFETWTLLPSINLVAQQGSFLDDLDLPDGVNQTNYNTFLESNINSCYPDFFGSTGEACLSPIIFDEDGKIIEALFGKGSQFSILGFAGPDPVEDGSGDPERRIIRRGQALFSGACLDPVVISKNGSCQRVLSSEEIQVIVTHEVGHMMGMDHSQVNPEAFEICASDPDGCPASVNQALPTMFPILVQGAKMLDLHRDDEAYFIKLYGDDLTQGCRVSGKVFASDGTSEVRGVEVVAVNVDPDLELIDRVSFISGAEAPQQVSFNSSQGNCTENCGNYEISHLQENQTYQICVQKIKSQFTKGSSIEPVDPPFQGFTDVCPQGLTVSCTCEIVQNTSAISVLNCAQITAVDIVTDADPAGLDSSPGDNNEDIQIASSGGCSLSKRVLR